MEWPERDFGRDENKKDPPCHVVGMGLTAHNTTLYKWDPRPKISHNRNGTQGSKYRVIEMALKAHNIIWH